MMKKFSLIICTAFLSLMGMAQQVKHVVIITIDGFRPNFYLDTPWHTPHLHELMQSGTYAKGVNSVFPSMTYPSHTTIVTGVQPAKHGVYFNDLFEPTVHTGKNYWNDSSIHMPTIWQAAHDKGLKTAALLWPVSANAPVDYDVPDIGGMGEKVREQYSKPAGFVDELKKQVFNGDTSIQYGKDQNVARIAAYVIKKDQPALMTIHFFSVDHAEHTVGRTGQMVKEAISDADEGVSIIEEALKQQGIWNSTLLIVAGDHGFHNVVKNIYPNVLLKNAGLLNDSKHDDWKAQFNTVGGSAYLYLKDKNDKATAQKVQEILEAQPDSIKHWFRIISRKQLDQVGANPEVAFALSAENDASFGREATGDITRPGKGGTHGHFPDHQEIQTGFIAHGPNIKTGGVINEMNLRDIAPLVAKELGFAFPSATGKIPAGLLTDNYTTGQ